MKENKNIDNDNSTLYTEETINPLFSHKIMSQKINKKLDIILSKEIAKRKKIIYELFEEKFGPNFIEKKKGSLNHFELLFGKYFFSQKSNFLLKYFPKLHRKFYHEKKIDLKKLKSKIHMGPMMYLTLRKHLVSNKSSINDKLLYISKNFSTKDEKDLVSDLYFKYKYKRDEDKKNAKIKYHSSTKSLNFGDLSQLNSNENGFKTINNLSKKSSKKVVFNIDLENDTKPKNITYNLDTLNESNNQRKKINIRNKKIIKFKTCLVKEKKPEKTSSKMLTKFASSDNGHNKFNQLYLSNPFYLYNLNVYNRNKIKSKKNVTESSSLTHDNYISPQISLKSKKANIILENSSLKHSNIENNTFFHSKGNTISPEYQTISSFKSLYYNLDKKKKKNKIKFLNDQNHRASKSNNIIINKINLINDSNEIKESEILKSRKKNNEIIKNTQNNKKDSTNFQNSKRIRYSLTEKKTFTKYLKGKTKKFKSRINSEVKLLNNCTNKCNKKLIKLIDGNFILSSKDKQKNRNKNVNFDITKLLLDDKIPKKVFIKYARNNNTIKPIVQKTVKDLTKFDKRNKNLGKNYFIKNINRMPTDLALYFIEELYPTKHIKFELKEYSQKRKEQKILENEYKITQARERAKHNLFKMKQLEYSLSNEKDAYFNSENNKIINIKNSNNIQNNNEK